MSDNKHWDNSSITTISSTNNCTDWTYAVYPYYGSPYGVGDPMPITVYPDYTLCPSVWYPVPVEKEELDEEKFKKIIQEAFDRQKTNKKEENIMKVFDVIVVDKKECEILMEKKIIAKDSETAMLELDLTPEIRKRVKKNQIEFIFRDVGQFNRLERKIKVEEEADED